MTIDAIIKHYPGQW